MAGLRWCLIVCIALSVQGASADTPEIVVVQGARQPSSPEACLKIAEAKVREWAQARLLRDRTDTFADGTTKATQIIFTENSLYQQVKGIWRTGQVLRNQRAADSAEAVEKRMGLAGCSNDGEAQEGGQAATIYTYAQAPDTTVEIWIADATDLPLRMEIDHQVKTPGQPAKISMHYAYGDAVQVPHLAELANFRRMMISQDWLIDLQHGQPTH